MPTTRLQLKKLRKCLFAVQMLKTHTNTILRNVAPYLYVTHLSFQANSASLTHAFDTNRIRGDLQWIFYNFKLLKRHRLYLIALGTQLMCSENKYLYLFFVLMVFAILLLLPLLFPLLILSVSQTPSKAHLIHILTCTERHARASAATIYPGI